jgi:hypothetical protein
LNSLVYVRTAPSVVSVDLEIGDVSPARALEVALEYDATGYDATCVALALDHDPRLLTAERTTTPWVVRLAERAVLLSRR